MVTAKGMQYAAIQNTECAQYVRKIKLVTNFTIGLYVLILKLQTNFFLKQL